MTTFILIAVFIVGLFMVLGLHTSDEVKTEIEIDSSANEVWKILSNFEEYAQWNPFITKISGELRKNAPIEVTIALPFSQSLVFPLKVERQTRGKEMVWSGETLAPNILDALHTFQINKLGPNKVQFVQTEKVSGLLLYILLPFYKSAMERNFKKMNLALKNKAEGVVAISEPAQVSTGAA